MNGDGRVNETALAEWKAGFIEDARELHLARTLFATAIRRWWDDPKVRLAGWHSSAKRR